MTNPDAAHRQFRAGRDVPLVEELTGGPPDPSSTSPWTLLCDESSSCCRRELGDPEAGTTYLTGTLTGMVSTAVTGRRPDVGAALAIAGILAGAAAAVGLLETFPDLTPFLAVACVAFTAGLSWIEHHRAPDPTNAAAVAQSLGG